MTRFQSQNQKLFEKFSIISCLKKDAGTAVYIADHTYLGKRILLKTLDKSTVADEATLRRFQREAKILAKLDHPNIIKVLDFGTYEQFFYISFEYFDSRSLRQVIKEGKLSHPQKVYILTQMVQGLWYAHQRGIVHRDLKPANLLVNDKLELKIADFGLAQAEGESIVTKKSSLVGTPAYMSPEQIRGEKLTPQSDMFSLGAIAFELFTGKNIFIGNDVSATINHILTFDHTLVDEAVQAVDKSIGPIIKNLLWRDLDKRTQSLETVLSQLGVSAAGTKSSVAVKPAHMRWLTRVAAVTLIVGLLIVLVIWKFLPGTAEKQILDQDQIKTMTAPVIADSIVLGATDALEHNVQKDNVVTPMSLPIGSNENENKTQIEMSKDLHIPGRLFIQCSPWADVFIDSQKVDTTPLEDTLRVFAGVHELRLVHLDYPPYAQVIEIKPMQLTFIAVDLDTVFGFLECNIYPWGEVAVDGKRIGQTPFFRPITLTSGQHLLTVKNPEYTRIDEYITITAKDTVEFRLNFEQIVESKSRL